jgi:hypothetical protein
MAPRRSGSGNWAEIAKLIESGFPRRSDRDRAA